MSNLNIGDELKDYAFIAVYANHTNSLVNTKKETLILQNKNITVLLPRTLVDICTYSLNISRNPLRFLPPIYSLRVLNCDNCLLKELPALPQLQELSCAGNLLTSIPVYKNATIINCSKNFISSIDLKSYPKLKKLNCSLNLITDLPNSKIGITCTNCPITTVYYNFAGARRSGIIKNGKFTWITEDTSTKYTIINWQTAKTTLVPNTVFAKKLFKFLFST